MDFCQALNLYFTEQAMKFAWYSGTIAEWVRVSALSHSDWMVPSSNPSESRHYFNSGIWDGGLSVLMVLWKQYINAPTC